MLRLSGASYRYPSASAPAVCVDLAVDAGEVVLLTGPTGCGKSTVLRLAAGLLARHGGGEVGGQLSIDGRDPATLPPSERVAHVGFVAQNPARQGVAGTVGDEVAFALRSAAWDEDEIASRLPEVLTEVGLDYRLDRPTSALSGGERQRLMVAAALAARPRLLVLDEPLAHLDPAGADRLMATLREAADGGVAVLLVEHRLPKVWGRCDRICVMEAGRVVADASPEGTDLGLLRRLGLRLPGLLDLRDRVGEVEAVAPASPAAVAPGEALLEALDLRWSWPSAPEEALRGVDLSVGRGERVAILGPNGAGKSTLLHALCVGRVRRFGRFVRVPQDPDLSLFCETVREEIAYGPRENRLSRSDVDAAFTDAAGALSVEDLASRAPHALSRGQRLRVAVASALACAPDVLVLDEPTSGQDHDQVERLMATLAGREQTLLFATHDVDLALRHATRILRVVDGRVAFDGSPTDSLSVLPDLPPLAAWCRDRGLAPATAADLAARVEADR